MSGHREPFERLTGRSVGTGLPDQKAAARAAVLIRLLQMSTTRLPASARARIAARLQQQALPAVVAPRRMLWPVAGAATLVLFAGGAVGATWGIGPAQKLFGRWMRGDDQPTGVVHVPGPTVEIPTTFVPQAAEPPALSAALAAPTALATTVIEPQAARLAAPEPRRRQAAAQVSVGVTMTDLPAPSEDPVAAESRLLAEALSLLRQRLEPARALQALDDYERRFPAGARASEASAARVDALLALGRRSEALDRLDALALDRLPRAAELRVLRGELRSGRGALVGAVSDFGAVLATVGASPSVIERALYGRGSCRARLGDTAGAHADLADYLRRFPRGQFAGPAERALRD